MVRNDSAGRGGEEERGEETDCTHMDRRRIRNMVRYYFLERWYSSLLAHACETHCRY